VAQHVERSAGVELLAHAVEEGGLGGGAVGLGQGPPGLGLGLLDPGDQVRGEQGAGAVVVLGVPGVVEPAVGA